MSETVSVADLDCEICQQGDYEPRQAVALIWTHEPYGPGTCGPLAHCERHKAQATLRGGYVDDCEACNEARF